MICNESVYSNDIWTPINSINFSQHTRNQARIISGSLTIQSRMLLENSSSSKILSMQNTIAEAADGSTVDTMIVPMKR